MYIKILSDGKGSPVLAERALRLGADPALRTVNLQVTQAAITFRQVRGYVSSQRASLPLAGYQIILLGDRGT